jgi:hypothetical protein
MESLSLRNCHSQGDGTKCKMVSRMDISFPEIEKEHEVEEAKDI